MPFEQITTDLADRVLTITLNRPDRLNAWTPTMGRELIANVLVGWIIAGCAPGTPINCSISWFHWMTWSGWDLRGPIRAWCRFLAWASAVAAVLRVASIMVNSSAARFIAVNSSAARFIAAFSS